MSAAHTTSSPNGFCWLDVKTHRPHDTANFFAHTLGWRFAVDEHDWRKATKIAVDGHQIGGVSDLSNPVYPPETPPHLAFYLSVDDVDSRVEGAAAAGAEVVVEPFDVAHQGRMATLVDPCGAAVSLWQAREFGGWTHPWGLPGTPHRMVLACAEPERAARFYSETLHADLTRVAFVASAPPDTGQSQGIAWELVVAVRDVKTVAERAGDHVDTSELPARLTTPERLAVRLAQR